METAQPVILLFSLIPAGAGVALWVVFQFYKLDEATMARIEIDLRRRTA